ncbi:F-box/kelch-repeat protein At1g67480-like [Zingiber officinale]|uniref:F-box/kelch-repeat protein At1g67480-like n=1 Tax=Zingiber officinale TaxID=94328 RepID=UPI001C4D2630|nr:F-box/kelch-repeat protein At1g67480-like [Zingiber officinale]
MGSLSSPPLSPSQPDQNPASGFRIFLSFSGRDETTDATLPNWLENYNPCDNTRGYAGLIPGIPPGHVLKDFSMVALAGFVYVIGGRLCLKEPPSGERDVDVRPDVVRYDVESGEWSACAPLALQRFDFACAACNGKIFVAGGLCSVSNARGTTAGEVYDPARDAWAPLPDMAAMRHKCVGVAWQGRFHVVGGFAQREGAGWLTVMERSSAEVFDEEQGKWELMPGMWQLDVPPNQIVEVGGRLFSSGDCLNSWKGHIETYDGKLNIWSVIERSQMQQLSSLVAERQEMRRVYLTMAQIGAHLYFVAGYQSAAGDGEPRSMSVVHAFDTAAGAGEAWGTFEPLMEDGNKELCSHCCVLQLSH